MPKIFILYILLVLVPSIGFSQPIKLADLKSINTSFTLDNKIALINSEQLILSDGTPQGTKTITLPPFAQNFHRMGNDILFFSYEESSDYHFLNKLSGSTGEISILGRVNKYNKQNIVRLVAKARGNFFFVAWDATNQPVLWQSDGTPEGTVPSSYSVSNFYQQGKSIFSMIAFGDMLLVVNSNSELWITNGISSFKKIKESIKTNFTKVSFNSSLEMAGFIYFNAYDSIHGQEIWRTDGTSQGTEMFMDLTPGFWSTSQTENNKIIPISSSPENFIRSGNFIYFTIQYNSALWRTDGTPQGTIQLMTCVANYCFRNLSSFNNKLIFTFTAADTGREPWVSDGTIAGTRLVKDIWPGPAGSVDTYYPLQSSSENIFIPANDGINGFEIWLIDNSGRVKKAEQAVSHKTTTNIPFIFEIDNKLMYAKEISYGNWQLFSIDNSSVSLVVTSATPRLPADYWFQTIGPAPPYSNTIYSIFNYDMSITPSNDVIIAGVHNGLSLNFYDNFFSSPIRYNTPRAFLSSFDTHGIVKWTKELQTTGMYYRKHASVATGADGSIYYSTTSYPGSYGSSFIDLSPTDKNVNAYIVKFDEAGTMKWFSGGYANQGIRISNLRADHDGNIFMTGLYFGSSFRWGNTSLTSIESPSYFIHKFDSNGNSIWAKNISTGWKEFGDITDMEIDHQNKRVILLISRGGRNVSSSCEFERWPAQLMSFDFVGNLLWQKQFDCSDLMMANSLGIGPNGDIIVVGLYRGTLTWESSNLMSGGCQTSTSFIARVNKEGELLSAMTDSPNYVEPFEVQFLKNGNYLISGIEKHKEANRYPDFNSPYPSGNVQMFIRQYDYGGYLLSERKYNKNANDFEDSNPIVRVDNNNDLIFSERSAGKFDSISYSISQEYARNLVLVKTKLPSFKNKIDPIAAADGILLFPNPSNDRSYLKIWRDKSNHQDFSIQIINLIGQIVYETKNILLNDVFAIDTSQLSPGTYIFKVSNSEIVLTQKLVVCH